MKLKIRRLYALLSLCSASLIYLAIPSTIAKAQIKPREDASKYITESSYMCSVDSKRKRMNPTKKARESVERAYQMYKTGQIQEALAEYNRAIELDPNYVEAYFFRGNLLGATGHIDNSVADLRKAAEICRSRGEKEAASAIVQFVEEIQHNREEIEQEIQEVQKDESL